MIYLGTHRAFVFQACIGIATTFLFGCQPKLKRFNPPVQPDAPTGIIATSLNQSAIVEFTAPSQDGGSPILNYTVVSNPDAIRAVVNSSPATISGLNNGTEYTFCVFASNKIGDGAVSLPSNPITPSTLPSAPLNVVATRGTNSASVAFDPPITDGGDPITSYTVTANPGGSTTSGAGSPISVSGLTNGVAYTFTVTATNNSGTSPASDASAAVTPATKPAPPTNLLVTPGNTQASISFTAPADDGGSAVTTYTATSSPGGFTGSAASSPVTVTGLTNGVSYTFTVTATNDMGEGVASEISSSVVPAEPPGAPTSVLAQAGSGQATVSFSVPASNGGSAITSYMVTSSPGGITASGSSSPIVITGLTNGTEYTFTVTASNAVGAGDHSAASDGIVPGNIPDPPTNLIATAGHSHAMVAFDAPADDGGSPVRTYTVTASPGGITATGTASPVSVTGLNHNQNYTFTITATNDVGSSIPSTASNQVLTASQGPFVSIWRTTTASESITLPLRSGYTYDFTVDWGDGSPVDTVTAWNDADKTHTYAVAGDYTVTISGTAQAWYFANSGDKNKIIQVVDFGDLGWTDLLYAFYGCGNMTSFSGGITNNVTIFTHMFLNVNNLSNMNISGFDTGKATSLRGMFQGVNLTSIDTSHFNTANVIDMAYLFGYMNNLTAADLSNFDTSKVTDMSYMFINTSNLVSLNLSSFDTSKVTNMTSMFAGTEKLSSIDLSNFNTSNVTHMTGMFAGPSGLTSLDLSSFDTSKVTHMSAMFFGASNLTSVDLSSFNTSSAFTLSNMFAGAASLTSLDLSNFDTSNVTSMASMFSNTSSMINLNISSFDTSNVVFAQGMFSGASSIQALDLSHFVTSNFVHVTEMFQNTTNLTSLNTTNWNISNITNSNDFFTNSNADLVVTCDQGGSPGTGTFFGKACH